MGGVLCRPACGRGREERRGQTQQPLLTGAPTPTLKTKGVKVLSIKVSRTPLPTPGIICGLWECPRNSPPAKTRPSSLLPKGQVPERLGQAHDTLQRCSGPPSSRHWWQGQSAPRPLPSACSPPLPSRGCPSRSCQTPPSTSSPTGCTSEALGHRKESLPRPSDAGSHPSLPKPPSSHQAQVCMGGGVQVSTPLPSTSGKGC